MFSGLNLSNVGFGGVEQYALFKLGRPDHLHLYQKDASPVVPAAHIDDAVFAERVVGYQLHRKIFYFRYFLFAFKWQQGVQQAHNQVGMFAEDAFERQVGFGI